MTGIFTKISLISLILILLIIAILAIRKRLLKSRQVEYGPTWGCGYTAGSAHQQYTGTSYAGNFAEIAQPFLQSKEEFRSIPEEEIFPGKRSFELHPRDIFRSAINRTVDFSMLALKKIARLQTGNIQHYILYAFIYILVIFVLFYLKVL